MTSSPITSWQTDGETVETVTDFILGDSKITAGGYYNHEIKRHLLLEGKHIKKQWSFSEPEKQILYSVYNREILESLWIDRAFGPFISAFA